MKYSLVIKTVGIGCLIFHISGILVECYCWFPEVMVSRGDTFLERCHLWKPLFTTLCILLHNLFKSGDIKWLFQEVIGAGFFGKGADIIVRREINHGDLL